MHHKETVIAPILEHALHVRCYTPPDLNTDMLGTFSGEVERLHDPVTTAMTKCLMAMELTGYDMAVASEGSFGPHPEVPFVTVDEEVLIYIDTKNNVEVIVRELSTDTNFAAAHIHTEQELLSFVRKVKFPSHGIILRRAKDDPTGTVKGITAEEELKRIFDQLREHSHEVYAETDMRAMYNPTRMSVIGIAARQLVARIQSLCPKCRAPGYGVTAVHRGLPCSLCGSETRSVLYHLLSCAKCDYTAKLFHPDGKTSENPMYCDHCNP
jgi:hypothetical protein